MSRAVRGWTQKPTQDPKYTELLFGRKQRNNERHTGQGLLKRRTAELAMERKLRQGVCNMIGKFILVHEREQQQRGGRAPWESESCGPPEVSSISF